MMRLLTMLLFCFTATVGLADEISVPSGGEVRVPLADYTALLERLNRMPAGAPAAYAIGRSDISAAVNRHDDRFAAVVDVTLWIETFEDEWALVPILPAGAALRSATVDGVPVQLVQQDGALSWSTNQAKIVMMKLQYGLDPTDSDSGFVLPLPVPIAAATNFNLSFPGTEFEVTVVPSADLRHEVVGDRTLYRASVPATSSILVSWRRADNRSHALSRAHYTGRLQNDALLWTARFEVDMMQDSPVILPLLSTGLTLTDIRVDGESATVDIVGNRFATEIQGRGTHQIEVDFAVPVASTDGPPRAELAIPRVPVSRFDLVLPGRKEVKVGGGVNVVSEVTDDETAATVFMPMRDRVAFTWTDAVPADLRDKVRANASLYHAVHAEEGVLHARAFVVYEITHGETNLLELEFPADAQINRITSPGGGVSDWAVIEPGADGRSRVSIYLDRPVTGEYTLDVAYERLLGSESDPTDAINVPLLGAVDVHRQRGMVAFLSGEELTLNPIDASGATKVGENQLPAFVRNQIGMTVAHTYKYTDPVPNLTVAAVAPERRQGRFDAQVDTLISLGEVTMKGAAMIEIDVKSGTITDLGLRLPDAVNVLAVTAPSLRTHRETETDDGGRAITMEFTREMDGQFRIEVNYERIMDGAVTETQVPTLSVADAEVEHGRIAVEALTAVEVQPSRVEQLSGIDVNELPQQLVLKTTNPILLAYRYVSAEQPPRLGLTITRHREIGVQLAAIEQAAYTTLFTRDGLAVTTARLIVRNSRRQFLRLALPAESEVWSVFVDGKPEKPAYASEEADAADAAILIRMINSAEGFPVDIVYATPTDPMGWLGQVTARLPVPDMVVTRSRWDVFLPPDHDYQTPDSTMDVMVGGRWANPRLVGAKTAAPMAHDADSAIGRSLRVTVPTQGIHFAFEKLYANQSAEMAGFAIGYTSDDVNLLGNMVSVVGAVLLWLGIIAIRSRRVGLNRTGTIAAIVGGLGLLAGSIGYLGVSPVFAATAAWVIAVLLLAWWLIERARHWRAARAEAV